MVGEDVETVHERGACGSWEYVYQRREVSVVLRQRSCRVRGVFGKGDSVLGGTVID